MSYSHTKYELQASTLSGQISLLEEEGGAPINISVNSRKKRKRKRKVFLSMIPKPNSKDSSHALFSARPGYAKPTFF